MLCSIRQKEEKTIQNEKSVGDPTITNRWSRAHRGVDLLCTHASFFLQRADFCILHLPQVVMDVLGVGITCVCCNLILDPVLHPSLHHIVQQPLLGQLSQNHT